MPYFLFMLVCTIWGASFILMKKAGFAFGSIGVGCGRVVGGAVVLSILWWLNRRHWKIERRHWGAIVLVGLIAYTWPYAVQPYLVVQYGSAFIGMTVAFVPLATILVSIPMLGIYPSRRQLWGVVGGLLCLALIMADGLHRSVPLSMLLLAFSVPLSYAYGNALIKKHLHDVAAVPVTCGALLVSAVVMVPLALSDPLLQPLGLGKPTTPPTPAQYQLAIISIVLLSTLGTGVAAYLFNKLVLDQGPLFAGMVTYLVPLGALLWGSADAEHISPLQVAALVGVLAMVAIVQFRAAAPARPRSAPAERIPSSDPLVD